MVHLTLGSDTGVRHSAKGLPRFTFNHGGSVRHHAYAKHLGTIDIVCAYSSLTISALYRLVSDTREYPTGNTTL